MIRKTVTFLKEVQSELSQVSWPAPRELWESTKLVLVTMILLGGVIGFFDLVCARLMSWIVRG